MSECSYQGKGGNDDNSIFIISIPNHVKMITLFDIVIRSVYSSEFPHPLSG